MNKKTLFLLLGSLSLSMAAQQRPLEGFYYGQMAAPTGWEWQSPDSLAYNKLQPRAWFFSFQDVESARRLLPENSEYYRSLNGQWAFKWVGNPEERPQGFQSPAYDVSAWDKIQVPMSWNIAGIGKDGSLKYGVPIYTNQLVIFPTKRVVDDWKKGVMRDAPADWPVHKHRNEVGSYRRSFTVPATWKGREVYINFDGVDSFFYLYINGRYVGFSENSRNTASFDISPYLKEGENVVAVEVYRNSTGSFLEAQDMWRLPGIFRTVSLTAKPTVQVADFVAIPDFDASFTNATLKVKAAVANLDKKAAKGYSLTYSLFENELFSDVTKPCAQKDVTVAVSEVARHDTATAEITFPIDFPVKKWSAEAPHRYTLVAQLKDKKSRVVETISTIVGFRKCEIRETPASEDEFGLAGRYYFLNGKPIKMKGVNRHETNPSTGHYVSREQMEREIALLKQGNINHVRMAHYPTDPYFFYLCDKYGIYVEDEANLESHEYHYGEASLSHVEKFRAAHVARNVEMVRAAINHPCVVIWSLGNEAGPGKNFVYAYDAIKAIDTTRPVQYERNNDIVDMGSNQYPEVDWIREVATGKANVKYPYHISEYAHSMGNACGNLADMWEAIESTNFFIGGAIWDWVDQSMYNYDPKTGERYFAYGGDFGDKPNDGMFCMNGIMRPDLTPKGQYYEVKKVYQNVGVKAVDMQKGTIEIFNKNYFEPLADYDVVWSLWRDGRQVGASQAVAGDVSALAARQRRTVALPLDFAALDADAEYFVKVQFLLKKDMPWAKKGYVQMEEQLPVKAAAPAPAVQAEGTLQQAQEGDFLVVSGKGFNARFDTRSGALDRLVYGGKTVIKDPLKIDAFRASVDNDNWADRKWAEAGLFNLLQKAVSRKVVVRKNAIDLHFNVESQAPYGATLHGGSSGRYRFEENKTKPFGANDFKITASIVYTILPDGSIEVKSALTTNEPDLALPRIGYTLQTPASFDTFTYYGRGPVNNYNDRKTGQFIEQHSTPVASAGIMLPKPQAQGNREDVRWCALTDAAGDGVAFVADGTFSASALPWSQQELMLAPHPYQLPASSGTHLHLDAKVTGLGGRSCGQAPPYLSDRAMGVGYTLSFLIRPVTAATLASQVKASLSGVTPVAASRNAAGWVTLTGKGNAPLWYSIDNGRPVRYTAPFKLREKGVVRAWSGGSSQMAVAYAYDRIETVPLKVVQASSQEPYYGEATALVDNDKSTIWHTAYGVTQTKYPHWVDFDANEVKDMRGFIYTPRQEGENGRVKDYSIALSLDGKTWTEVMKGSFANGSAPQRVLFAAPVRARYIRFTALSEQRGQDFASGAEFGLIAD